jgi:hypothetical protein
MFTTGLDGSGIEIIDVTGKIDAMALELQHLPAMLGGLAPVRKVALIADQYWVEVAAKAEAGIFGSVQFAFFEPGQDVQARP